IYGCLPKDGGYYPQENQDSGAIAPDQRFPDDYNALQDNFSQFESKTPTSNYLDFNGYFSTPSDIVSVSTATNAASSTYFLQNGLNQALMFTNAQYGLAGKTVDFDLNTLSINNFYYLSHTPPFVPIDPQPVNDIPIGTIVLVTIQATIDGAASNYFQSTYMLKIKSGQSFWYVWYGDQNPLLFP
ncbi:MAG: hypothetical protein ACHQYQ_05380, partial [Bacteriovoracales bacterium]